MADQPNLFELSGNGIHVTYTTTSLQGKPLFNYHDAFQVKNFSGDEIQTAETVLGILVTVFLIRTSDSGSTTFTLLVPSVNLLREHHHGRHHDSAQIQDPPAAGADRTLYRPQTPRPRELCGLLERRGRVLPCFARSRPREAGQGAPVTAPARRQRSAGAACRRRNKRSAGAADAKPGWPAADHSGTSRRRGAASGCRHRRARRFRRAAD
jgi:hypothetical protein